MRDAGLWCGSVTEVVVMADRGDGGGVSAWCLVFVWVVVVWSFSIALFTSVATAKVIAHGLNWRLAGRLSPATLRWANIGVRKACHFFNYAILFILMIRGPLRHRPQGRRAGRPGPCLTLGGARSLLIVFDNGLGPGRVVELPRPGDAGHRLDG